MSDWRPVVRLERVCPGCDGGASYIVKLCPTCNGTGLERGEAVNCGGCKHFDRYGYTSAGWCKNVENPDAKLHITRPGEYAETTASFSCESWEARE